MSNTVVVCRSSQEIYDDELCELHSALTRDLNELCCGVLLHRGDRRKQLEYLLQRVNLAILGEIEIQTFDFWYRLACAVRY